MEVKDITNTIFDVIIIGNSKYGKALMDIIRSIDSSMSCIIVEDEFVHSTFSYGLHKLIKDDSSYVVGKNIVIATNSVRKRINTKITNINYDISTIIDNKVQKFEPIVLCGNGNKVAKDALTLARRKYKYIYICCETEFCCDKKYMDQVSKFSNIAILQFSKIKSLTQDKNFELKEIILSTYDKIATKNIVLYTDMIPNIPSIFRNTLKTDQNGFVVVSNYGESVSFESVYAVGDCISACNKKYISLVAENICKVKG